MKVIIISSVVLNLILVVSLVMVGYLALKERSRFLMSLEEASSTAITALIAAEDAQQETELLVIHSQIWEKEYLSLKEKCSGIPVKYPL